MTASLILLGAGGHARVLIELMRAAGQKLLGCAALERERPPGLPKEVAYLGTEDRIVGQAPAEVMLVNGLGSVKSCDRRAELFLSWKARGYSFATLVHPSAVIAAGVALGEGSQVMAGAVIQPAVQIAENCIVNTRASLDHDCRIGAHSHIAPGAVLSGEVEVGERVHVGVGAAIIQGVTIGRKSIIGAGAAVIDDVGEGLTVAGVPARATRR